jgi:putative Mg2+ transporter-C (MgtC) family protein
MNDLSLGQMALKLVIAAVLGGLIGLERETHGRPAGLRTHILVCLGSTLFALSSYAIAGTLFDPGRVTAQIVTGIGFLGAGTIIRQGSVIRGLTTAASIWIVAAIGVAVAIGDNMLLLGMFATAIVIITLFLIPRLERRALGRRNEQLLSVVIRKQCEAIPDLLSIIARHDAQLRTLECKEGAESGTHLIRTRLRVGPGFNASAVAAELVANENIIGYSWE